ncbi:MAG: hypothetical protein RUDDFDWM_000209 [Candidatus Fervidibacterota bacterium]
MLLNSVEKHRCRIILDVGCGTGGNLELLSSYGVCIGIDISPLALSICKKHWDGNLICADASSLPFRNCSVDLVAALDVLEHLQDDVAALSEFWRILKPNGLLIMTVPAFMFLWSGHDVALRHFRRYTMSELKMKLRKAGFVTQKLSYAICPLLPFVFIFRKLQLIAQHNMKKHTALIELPKPLNEALIAMLQLEATLLKYIDLPFGVSLICKAIKPSV